MATKERCSSCRHWVRSFPNGLFGDCRARPPVHSGTFPFTGAWPEVTEDKWCGGYRHAEPPPEPDNWDRDGSWFGHEGLKDARDSE